MSNQQTIEALCRVCAELAGIVRRQQALLAQHDAAALAEDIGRAQERYTALLGRDEWPEHTETEAEK